MNLSIGLIDFIDIQGILKTYRYVPMLYVDEQEMLSSAKYIGELGEKTIYFGHGKPKRNRKWVK